MCVCAGGWSREPGPEAPCPTRCAPRGARSLLPTYSPAQDTPPPTGPQGLPSSLQPPPGTPRPSALVPFPQVGPLGSSGPALFTHLSLLDAPCLPPGSDLPPSLRFPPVAPTPRAPGLWPPHPWGSDAHPAAGGGAQTLPLHLCLACVQRLPQDPPPCAQGLKRPHLALFPFPGRLGLQTPGSYQTGADRGETGRVRPFLPSGPRGRRRAAPTPHLRTARNVPGPWVLLSLE